jgi:hypothetical protein
VIIWFKTRKHTVDKVLARLSAVYFPDNRHHFYIGEGVFIHQLKKISKLR